LNNQIYLDYAATTPMAPEAARAMAQCLTTDGVFVNPASLQHGFGEQAHALIEKSRAEIASLLNCNPTELIFTSGATESNNLAIKGIALSYQKKATISLPQLANTKLYWTPVNTLRASVLKLLSSSPISMDS